MLRRTTVALFALLIATPLTAQVPEGMQMRVDLSTNSADPDDVPEVDVRVMGDGFHVNTGPAVVLWKDDDTASRPFTLSGRFVLGEPSRPANYYGLIYGGGSLDETGQNYMYFLVAQNGTYIVKHRAGESVHDIQARTPHDAVQTPNSDGRSVNQLEVRVGRDETDRFPLLTKETESRGGHGSIGGGGRVCDFPCVSYRPRILWHGRKTLSVGCKNPT